MNEWLTTGQLNQEVAALGNKEVEIISESVTQKK